VADAPYLAKLWTVSEIHFEAESVVWDLTATSHPDLVLVAEGEAEEVAGVVFGTFDGRRGWVNRLAVDPGYRGRGIATALLDGLERRLAAKGCPKVNLLVEPGNAGAAALYAKLGYQVDELIFMEKFL
jgi:ribosomal protein S18 acetylase RimI-like enzyme